MPRRSPSHPDAHVSLQVGGRLKEKRLAAGLTLEKVSHLTQISISSLSRFENGIYQLTVLQLEVLATALRCPSTALLTACTEGGGH